MKDVTWRQSSRGEIPVTSRTPSEIRQEVTNLLAQVETVWPGSEEHRKLRRTIASRLRELNAAMRLHSYHQPLRASRQTDNERSR